MTSHQNNYFARFNGLSDIGYTSVHQACILRFTLQMAVKVLLLVVFKNSQTIKFPFATSPSICFVIKKMDELLALFRSIR